MKNDSGDRAHQPPQQQKLWSPSRQSWDQNKNRRHRKPFPASLVRLVHERMNFPVGCGTNQRVGKTQARRRTATHPHPVAWMEA